jgi:hypothetical protein
MLSVLTLVWVEATVAASAAATVVRTGLACVARSCGSVGGCGALWLGSGSC